MFCRAVFSDRRSTEALPLGRKLYYKVERWTMSFLKQDIRLEQFLTVLRE